jgi:hypothetical protein
MLSLVWISPQTDCKSTNFSRYGKIKNATAGKPAVAKGSIGRIYLVFLRVAEALEGAVAVAPVFEDFDM